MERMKETPYQDQEGVIKFRLDFKIGPGPVAPIYSELEAWRVVLHRLGLTGQDPQRYGGLAYGNVSRRLVGSSFLISGSQTGGMEKLESNHYCFVDECFPVHNRIAAHGPIRPSSEAMSHGAIYNAASWVNAVLHVHSPLIWDISKKLGLTMTDPDIRYGTPEMATAITAQLKDTGPSIISMGGHRDGLIAFGESTEAAALVLIRYFALAHRIQASAA
jgi:ribulose-5-phosphate 4-epimerase/fuculose-1-phosphate aldolase